MGTASRCYVSREVSHHVSSNMFGATMSSIIAGARNKRRKSDSSAGRVLLPQRKKSRAHLQLLQLPRDLLAQMVTNPLLIECSTQSQLKGRQRMLMKLRATSQLLSKLTGTIKMDSWTCAGARNMELALSWVVSRWSGSLRHLHLPKMSITDSTLVALTDLSDQLHQINLSSCITLTDGMVAMIARRCSNLKSLGLRRCYALTDKAYISVAESCPQLVSLDGGYTNIGHSSLDAVSLHCTSIQVVNLSHCHAITDISVSNLLMRCPQLYSLDLDRCVGLTDAALKNPGSSLQHLNLRLCVLITDLTLQSLSSLRLKTLNLHSTLVRNPLGPNACTIVLLMEPVAWPLMSDRLAGHRLWNVPFEKSK